MDPESSIERFCFLGTFEPVYISNKREIESLNIGVLEIYTIILQAISGENFLKLIKKCLNCQYLPSRDKAWLMYATYLLSNTTVPNKSIVSDGFSELAQTNEDFFLFVRYCKMIRNLIEKPLFTTTIHNAIKKWYDRIDLSVLADMLSEHNKLYGMTHLKIIKICHVNVNKSDGMIQLLRAAYTNNIIRDLEEINITPDMPEYLQNFMRIKRFKSSQDFNEMSQLIQTKILKFKHLPVCMWNMLRTWQSILPIMTYRQVIDVIVSLVEHKFFENINFTKQFARILSNREQMIAANIHPIKYLYLKSIILKQCRYSEEVKRNFNFVQNRLSFIRINKNPYICDKISKIFEFSFKNYKCESIPTFITINLTEQYKKLKVCNQKQANCYQSGLTLALSYFKCHRNSVLYTYTIKNKNNYLRNIQLNKYWNYTQVQQHCEYITLKRTYQDLTFPLIHALQKKQVYELFLIIVASSVYKNTNNNPNRLIRALYEYREKRNKNAKVVVVNMRRYKAAMEHECHYSNGILEICGLDENAPKIIHAFSLGYFN